MKTIINGTNVMRVTNEEAEQLVKGGNWRYCAKRFFKAEQKRKDNEAAKE